MAELKRILFLTNLYHPLVTPCSMRLAALATHLSERGYAVSVLAPDWSRENVHLSNYDGNAVLPDGPLEQGPVPVHRFPMSEECLKGLARKLYHGFIPLRHQQHLAAVAYQHAEALHQKDPIDLVMATAPLHYTYLTADRLKRKHGISWIADLRDVRYQIAHSTKGLRRLVELARALTFYKQRCIAREIQLCASAQSVVTVTEVLVEMLRERGLPRVHLVMNGYRDEDYQLEPVPAERFRVIYAGAIHYHRPPDRFFDALDLLIKGGEISPENFELHFYGSAKVALEMVANRPCAAVVQGFPRVSKQAIIRLMRGSSLLLHLSTPSARGIMTSKLTDYLGTGRPVLSVPGDGDIVDAFLKNTGIGTSMQDPEQIADHLRRLMREREEEGQTACHRNEAEARKYTWDSQVDTLIEEIEGALK